MALGLVGCASGGNTTPEGGIRDVAETTPGPSDAREGPHIMYTNSDLPNDAVVPSSLDSAYAALQIAYRSLGMEIKTSDPAQHMLGNRHIVVMRTFLGSPLSTFFSCGMDPAVGRPRADTYQLVISVVSTLTAKDAGDTRVSTLASAQANDIATSASSVYCPSTGKLERSLLRAAGFQSN